MDRRGIEAGHEDHLRPDQEIVTKRQATGDPKMIPRSSQRGVRASWDGRILCQAMNSLVMKIYINKANDLGYNVFDGNVLSHGQERNNE